MFRTSHIFLIIWLTALTILMAINKTPDECFWVIGVILLTITIIEKIRGGK